MKLHNGATIKTVGKILVQCHTVIGFRLGLKDLAIGLGFNVKHSM